jgi:peptide/nickel transport system substrate-binding protein
MIANALSGDVDLLLPLGVEIEGGAEVQRRWQGTGNQVKFLPQEFLWQVQIQHRAEYSRPSNGFTVRSVRQGFMHAIDRQTLVDVVTQGLAPVADSWFPPDDALRSQLADAIPQFPYDPTRAQQLLAEAGWTRGSDGVLVHNQTGERFEVELRGNQAGALDSQMNVIADGWKAVGAQVNYNVVPTARVSDAEYAAQFPGGYVWFLGAPSLTENRLHSRQIASAANRWAARNRVGYNNPRVDSLLDRLVTTIDARARLQLHRELLQEQMGDVGIMPLYWDVAPLIMARGVSGPIGGGGRVIPNFFGWRKD